MLKTKLGLYHVELRKPKASTTKILLTLVETQQLPDIEKFDWKFEISILKWTIYNGRRKVCINFRTDTDKVNIVVYPYRKKTYLKDTEMELKLTEYKKLLAKRVNLLNYIDNFLNAALYWTKQLFIIDSNSVANGRSPSRKHFQILLESKGNF